MKPQLYDYVQKKEIKEMLQAFEACIHLPIQIIDDNGQLLLSYGKTISYCQLFEKHLPPGQSCAAFHADAGRKAATLGESYVFSCHANLNHIVMPLISHTLIVGSVLVGPFLMDQPDATMILALNRQFPMNNKELLELYEEAAFLPVVEPGQVTHINRILYYMFTNLLTDSKQSYILNQGKFHQQARINESIQMYKTVEAPSSSYPYEKEKILIAKVKMGNVQDAKGILNDLLGYVLFSEGNSLDIVKPRAIELCSLLSRAAIEGGGAADNILKLNNQFLKNLQKIDSLEELCYKLQEIVEAFTDNVFNINQGKHGELIKKAIGYISRNYASDLTLDEVAKYVHLNASYFSSIFKQTCGSSFKEYLNMVRVEESKRLLANTDYSIIDIAIATGFEDQSYFSKVFKKYTGLTPKQFR